MRRQIVEIIIIIFLPLRYFLHRFYSIRTSFESVEWLRSKTKPRFKWNLWGNCWCWRGLQRGMNSTCCFSGTLCYWWRVPHYSLLLVVAQCCVKQVLACGFRGKRGSSKDINLSCGTSSISVERKYSIYGQPLMNYLVLLTSLREKWLNEIVRKLSFVDNVVFVTRDRSSDRLMAYNGDNMVASIQPRSSIASSKWESRTTLCSSVIACRSETAVGCFVASEATNEQMEPRWPFLYGSTRTTV